ncbi:hypothetical protein BGW39_006551, partial [Mortierella sp. 14UC]
MKKLLWRRRGHTSEDTGLGIVGAGSSSGASGGSGHGSTISLFSSSDAVASVGSPGGPGMIHSFVIVGGQGAVAAGSTVYDLEPPSPVSPTATHMISPPSSSSSICSPSFSPTARASSGSMGPLVGTTGMISPRSPTFPKSMMTRFSTGRDHHQQQQQHPLHSQTQSQMHMQQQQQQFIPAEHVTSSSSSTLISPIAIPTRGRSRQPSIPNAAATSPPVSVIGPSGQVQSLSLSAAHLHRRLNRRSLSADSLWSDNEPSASPAPTSTTTPGRSATTVLDIPVRPTASVDQKQQRSSAPFPSFTSMPSPSLSPLSSDRHGRIQGDVEFFKKSVEFLRTHHSRHNTADDWANRNKRKVQLPPRRQSESCLLDRIADTQVVDTANNKGKDMLSSSVPEKIESEEWQEEEPRAFGPGSCWKDLDPSRSSMMDFDHLVDDGDRSLLSSVDILLMPIISSPTRFYDCPRSRKLVRTYLTSKGREFDEMIEFGFPLTYIVDDNRSISSSSSSKDCRFLTLRLTLTPWHARADEAKLYGSDDAAAAGAPIKERVNKFLSRTSAKLSCSPPRILSLLPDARSVLSAVPDRKMSLTPDSTLSALSFNNGAGSSAEVTITNSPLSQTPRSHLDASLASLSQLPPTGPRTIKSSSNNSGPISPASTGAALRPRREKGFRIMDPSTMSSPIPLSLTTSVAPLLRTVNSPDYLSIDPSSPGIMSSPPSTPSPTTTYPYQAQHPYSQQQHQLPPRKGSLTVMSTYYFQQQQTLHSTGSFDDLSSQLSLPPAVPARRKASSPAIFNTTPISTANTQFGTNNGPRYQNLAPTPPPEIMNSPPRSRSTSPFVATNNNYKSNKFSTSPPSPQPMPGITTTPTTAAPIPIPGAGSRYPHHRPPIYGSSTPTATSASTIAAASPTTTWSETDVYGAPSARIARPRRHDSSEHLHSQSPSQSQQTIPSSPSSTSATSGASSDTYR